MALTREDKTKLIDQLTEDIGKAKALVFTEYRGMTMQNSYQLRTKLREAGVNYQVIKTTLLDIALKNNKISVPGDVLDKPMAVAIGFDDEVIPAKVIAGATKEIDALKILGGVVNNEFANAQSVKQLASLPGRDELYAKVVGSLASPMTGLVGVLQGNIRGLVSVLKQHQAKIS